MRTQAQNNRATCRALHVRHALRRMSPSNQDGDMPCSRNHEIETTTQHEGVAMNTVHILFLIAVVAFVIACELCRQLTGVCNKQRKLLDEQNKRLAMRKHLIDRLAEQRRYYKRKWEATRD